MDLYQSSVGRLSRLAQSKLAQTIFCHITSYSNLEGSSIVRTFQNENREICLKPIIIVIRLGRFSVSSVYVIIHFSEVSVMELELKPLNA